MRGERAGRWVLIDSAGMTVVDRLVVVTSDDLDTPEHPSEQVAWVAPEDLDSRLGGWAIEWTEISADVTGERFAPEPDETADSRRGEAAFLAVEQVRGTDTRLPALPFPYLDRGVAGLVDATRRALARRRAGRDFAL